MSMFNPMNKPILSSIHKMDILLNDIRSDVEGICAEEEHILDREERSLYVKFANASLDIRNNFAHVIKEGLKKNESFLMTPNEFFTLLRLTESKFDIDFSEELIQRMKKIEIDEYMKHILSDFDKDLMAFDEIGREYIRA